VVVAYPTYSYEKMITPPPLSSMWHLSR